ncbi:MAG: SMP-30/gluconolactonase/LRE family protein [Alphaproteobacteria bacterium]|nr:SMP-30/gluconolactonase/LRE family protein [Alphaproteobacteria bacterium]
MERRTFLAGAAGLGIAVATGTIAKAQILPLGPLPGTRYPDPRLEIVKPGAFRRIGNTPIERIATGFHWAEGPVYVRDGGYLLWSDIPNNRIMRWSEDDGHVSVFRSPSNYSNGHTRDREGRLISCEHDTRRVTRTEHDGAITVLMDRFDGKLLNSPNDVVVSADGAVWFTDPGFGKLGSYESTGKAPLELPPSVYRLDPRTGRASVVYTPEAGRPNGLAFSPDEKKLYLIVMAIPGQPGHIRVFDVAGERLTNGKIFPADFSQGGTDGVRCDTDGNVWCSVGSGNPAEDGVRCYTADGELIGKIHLPETCANLCFGGKKKNRLFMTASTSVYAVYVDYTGAMVP